MLTLLALKSPVRMKIPWHLLCFHCCPLYIPCVPLYTLCASVHIPSTPCYPLCATLHIHCKPLTPTVRPWQPLYLPLTSPVQLKISFKQLLFLEIKKINNSYIKGQHITLWCGIYNDINIYNDIFEALKQN